MLGRKHTNKKLDINNQLHNFFIPKEEMWKKNKELNNFIPKSQQNKNNQQNITTNEENILEKIQTNSQKDKKVPKISLVCSDGLGPRNVSVSSNTGNHKGDEFVLKPLKLENKEKIPEQKTSYFKFPKIDCVENRKKKSKSIRQKNKPKKSKQQISEQEKSEQQKSKLKKSEQQKSKQQKSKTSKRFKQKNITAKTERINAWSSIPKKLQLKTQKQNNFSEFWYGVLYTKSQRKNDLLISKKLKVKRREKKFQRYSKKYLTKQSNCKYRNNTNKRSLRVKVMRRNDYLISKNFVFVRRKRITSSLVEQYHVETKKIDFATSISKELFVKMGSIIRHRKFNKYSLKFTNRRVKKIHTEERAEKMKNKRIKVNDRNSPTYSPGLILSFSELLEGALHNLKGDKKKLCYSCF